MGQYAHRDAQKRTLANGFRAIRPARKPLSQCGKTPTALRAYLRTVGLAIFQIRPVAGKYTR